MALREAIEECVDEMSRVASNYLTGGPHATVPLTTLQGFIRELKVALKASEGAPAAPAAPTSLAAPQTAQVVAERPCTHQPRSSGLCRCNGDKCPVCAVCRVCGKVGGGVPLTVAAQGDNGLRISGSPVAGAVKAEERFSGGHYECVGGMLDCTTIPMQGNAPPPIGARTEFNGEVYVLEADGRFHYSVDESMKFAQPPAETPKLIIPGKG